MKANEISAPGAPRLPALTGIRILAALAVYASHVGPPASSPEFVQTFFFSGYSGVTLFFVLSGFVLAINYLGSLSRPTAGGIYRYFVARFARVYPLYALILFYFVVRQHALGESIDGWWQSALAIQAWSPSIEIAYSFDPPAWSIGVEFFLYACFPLMIPLMARLRRPRTILIAAAAVTVAMASLAGFFVVAGLDTLAYADPDSAHRWLYRMPLTRLGDFSLGILAALLYFQARERPSVKRLGLPLVLAAVAATVLLMCWGDLAATPWSWDLAYAAPATIFIFGLAVAPLSWPAKLLSLPFMILLGEASYAFYLVHHPALAFFGGGAWGAIASPTTIVFEALTLGAILALAIGLHVGFERPARAWIRRVFARRRDKPEPIPLPLTGRPGGEPVPARPAGEPASP